ncbi:MAG: hypothetical protein JSV66_04055 [Trueperaceae bacterium]|nr:MAG: hypothetical protein JSV66_04055 [Trueperaceae bacterium]
MKKVVGKLLVLTTAGVLITTFFLAQSREADAELEIWRFDVAEVGSRFVFDESPVFDDGMPSYGNAFVTQGYIYPEGTLNGSNGVLPNGEPEFPNLVFGEWTCRGWFIGDGAHTETGPWVVTTQFYTFGGELDGSSLVTDGYEIADVNVTGSRPITGGTGTFNTARGEAFQTLLGFNESQGVNLRFEFAVNR